MLRMENLETLKELVKKESDYRVRFKMLIILLVDRTKSVKEVSGLTGVPPPTIYGWVKDWNQKALEGLQNKQGRGGGRKPKLTDEQREEVKKTLKEDKEYWATKEVIKLIEERFGVRYSEDQVYRILRGFGMEFQKPYPMKLPHWYFLSPSQSE